MINLGNFSSIFVANWKLNGNIEFIDKYYQNLLPNSENCTVICSPHIFLKSLKSNKVNLFAGAQDVSEYNEGAYTGEISAKMLQDEKIMFCIVGHSERRMLFNEENEVIYKKITNLINNKIIPIICIGETLEEKEKNLTTKILEKQIDQCIPKISNYKNSIIAYEPIWAIGTGLTPSNQEIEHVHSFIKNHQIKYTQFKVLYGGSVKASNSKEINSLNSVDGCLVGGSSLKVDEFNSIIS